MDNKPSKKPSAQRIAIIASCTMLGLVLVLLIGTAVYADHFLNQLNYIEPQPTELTMPAETTEALPTETQPQPTEDPRAAELKLAGIELDSTVLQEFDDADIVNLLLVGKDSGSSSGGRSDTIILCTFNKERETIVMTSFLRDLYVKIPGYHDNRINVAYSLGGIELLKETLYENFGVRVDGSLQVDFRHFQQIIDLLGGVTIELTDAEAAFINNRVAGSGLSKGEQLLNGKQALTYARNRYDIDGDFSRTNRQRKLMTVILETFKSKKMTEMLSLAQEMASMVTTDISKSDLLAYAVTLFPMLTSSEIQSQAIPVEDGYYNATVGGSAVLMPDMEKNIQALIDSLT